VKILGWRGAGMGRTRAVILRRSRVRGKLPLCQIARRFSTNCQRGLTKWHRGELCREAASMEAIPACHNLSKNHWLAARRGGGLTAMIWEFIGGKAAFGGRLGI